MNRNHPPFAVLETSDGFLGPLWRGTMQSLLDRTREDGFCQTSFGEENGVKCYGVCHYSRDAAEAAGVLADQGCPEPAARILDFTLSHIPEGQYFIVHAYRPDGTPLHNKIQIDTPAHPARALARLLETGADDPALPRCFDRLDRVFDDTWRHHFQAAFRLLDSGNYNEQLGGGTEPLLDLFTNGAMYGGCLAMAEAARLLNRPATVANGISNAPPCSTGASTAGSTIPPPTFTAPHCAPTGRLRSGRSTGSTSTRNAGIRGGVPRGAAPLKNCGAPNTATTGAACACRAAKPVS